MTLLTTVQDVCAAAGVARPASVFSGLTGNRTMQEMLALANEMAQRTAYDTREWNKLKKSATLTGDGFKEAFDLPSDFKRMLKTAQVWRSTSALQPMVFYPDTDEYLQRRALNYQQAFGEWTMYGGQMHIWPIMGQAPAWANSQAYAVGTKASDTAGQTIWQAAVPHTSATSGTFAAARAANPTYWVASPATVTARFSYLDKNCVTLAAGGVGDAFMADGDTFRINERLLKLSMIWQWKAAKGAPYAEDMSTYNDALNVESGADTPAPILVERLPLSWSGRTAYPWPLQTP